MTENIDNQLQRQSKKINYLLSKTSQKQQDLQFSNQEVTQLQSIIALFSDLEKEGASKEELFDQLKYLSDINTFKEIENELNQQYTSTQNGVHGNIYTFNFSNYSVFNDLTLFGKPIDLPTTIGTVFQEGYLIFQCTPNLMIANKNNIILDVASTLSRVLITLDETVVKCQIDQQDHESFTIISSYDQLIGSKIRDVPNKQFYLLKYIYDTPKTVQLQMNYLTVNTINKTTSVQLSPHVIINKLQFESFISNLPPRVTLMSLGFMSRSDNEIKTIENLFIINRLKTFEDDLYSAFSTEFANSNVNSLYGQSAAVGISQLYDSLGSTVRRLFGEYNLNNETEKYVGFDIPNSFNSFVVSEKNKFDVFGNSFPIVFSKIVNLSPPASGSLVSYVGMRFKIDDYPSFNLLNEIGGQYVTNSTLAQTRLAIKKSKVKQVLSDGTVEILDCWIEGNTSSAGIIGESIKGTWANVDGTILNAQIDGDFNNYIQYDFGMSIDLEGFQISVHDPNRLIVDGTKCKIMHGYKHTQKTTSQVRFVINVSNVSQDGNVSQNVNMEIVVNGVSKSVRLPLEKQKIAYGDGEIMAYIVTLDTITDSVTYYTGATMDVEFTSSNPYPYYLGRSPSNVPNDLYNRTVNAPLNKYIGTDNLMQVSYGNNGQYVAVDPIGTGGTRPQIYNLKRAIMGGPTDDSKPIVGTCVPYLKPIINNQKTTYDIDIADLKMTYLALVNNPRVQAFTVGGSSPLNIKATMDTAYDTSGQYKPVTYYSGGISKIQNFTKYSNLNMTQLSLITTLETWIDTKSVKLPEYSVKTFSVTIADLFLPNTVLNQINLSETIVQLQTAVQFLKYYATYLETLIDNLDQRVIYVEGSLKEIVNHLNALHQQSQSSLGFAGNLISFLGTGIGMFFPLIGLGVSLLGGILTSVDKIEQGDVLMGSIDLIVGGMMATLGVYKYSQRLKNKYGESIMPKSPNVDSKNVLIKPGYIIINNDPPPMYSSGRRKNGIMRSTNLSTETNNGITTTISTTRMNRQTTLWNDLVWTDNPIYESPRSIAFQGVYIETIKESNARSVTINKIYKYVMCRTNADGSIDERILTNNEFQEFLDVDSSTEDYVKLELLYTQVSSSYNTNLGMDDETNVCLMASNGYLPTVEAKKLNMTRPVGKWMIRHSHQSSKKRKQEKENRILSKTSGFGPKLGIETMYDAMNPYRQLESAQIELYQNCISEIELINLVE